MRPDPKAAFALGLAAIFLLVCVGMAFAIDPDLLSRRVRWVARFDRVASLDEGAAVTFNGAVVGRVARITWMPEARVWRTEFRVDPDVAPPRYGGVRVEETNPLAGATITILAGAACDDRRPPAPDSAGGEAVGTCRPLPGMLDLANGILEKATDITTQVAALVDQLKSSMAPSQGQPTAGTRVQDMADNLAELVKSVRDLVDSLNTLQPDLKQTLATTRGLAANANDLVVRTIGIEDGLRRDTLARLNHTLDATDTLVRQSGPPLQQSLSDAHYIMGASSTSIVRLVTQLDAMTANLAEITRQLRDDPGMLLHGRSLENPPGTAGRSK